MGSDKKGKDKKRKLPSSSASPKAKRNHDTSSGPTWEGHQGYTVVHMEAGQVVYLMGQATLDVLEGTVQVDGRLLTVGSPATSISTAGRNGLAITICAQPESERVPFASNGMIQLSLAAPTPQQRQHQQQQSEGTEPSQLDGVLNGDLDGEEYDRLHFSLHLPGDVAGPCALKIPEDWEQVVQAVCAAAQTSNLEHSSPPIITVCGGKGLGKSSLARLLINRLLNCCPDIMYLDTDCGQPEFTPPGMVSIVKVDQPVFGPPCTHLRQPSLAHYLGDTSAQGDPELYVNAIRSLYSWYCLQGANPNTGRWPPLIVNTHGWVKGVGLDVISEVLAAVAPSHVLQFQSPSEGKGLPQGMFWVKPDAAIAAPSCTILTLASATTSPMGGAPSPASVSGNLGISGKASQLQRVLKPAESRALQWHAWARSVAGINGTWGSYEGEELWQDAGSLAAHRPQCVPLADLNICCMYEGDLPKDQIAYALNGSVVGLAEVHKGQEGPPYCWGVGLVRAVDMDSGLLYILTPLAWDSKKLQKVNTLLMGKSDIPNSLLQVSDQAVSPYLTLFSLSNEGTASGGAKSRTTLERRGLVRTAGS